MHRMTARLLLFFALVGNLVPLALAATAAPPRACCLRKGVHHCQDSQASKGEQLVIRDASCRDRGCGRAVTITQWAHPQSQAVAFFLQTIKTHPAGSQPKSPANPSAEFQSSRAPPAC
jgi:hypothetical protein